MAAFSESRPNQIHIFRFSIGVTIAVALAYGFNWPLAFLMPVFTSLILSMPYPMPSLQAGLRNMRYTILAFSLGLIFSLFFVQYPFAYILLLVLVLFHLYYFNVINNIIFCAEYFFWKAKI